MNRLSFASVAIEITRKCNLNCSHCFKGDAQNIDMSHDIIDAFLSKTAVIYRLHFTGGEPTLNIDGIRYFLEACKKYHVALCHMSFTTNGTIQNQELIELIRDYSDYISNFLENDGIQRVKVSLSVSIDRYHAEYTDCESNYQWYKDNLSDFANVTKTTNGNVPVSNGRAKALPYSLIADDEPQTKIQYKGKDNKCYCTNSKQYKLLYPEQVIILCKINVDANGIIGASELESYDSCGKWDICNVFTDDYIKAIDIYNADKPYCLETKNEHGNLQSHQNNLERLNLFGDKSIKIDYIYKMMDGLATKVGGNPLLFGVSIASMLNDLGLNLFEAIKILRNPDYSLNKAAEISNKIIPTSEEEKFMSETQTTERERMAMVDCICEERYGKRYGTVIGLCPQLTQAEREEFMLHMKSYDLSTLHKKNHPSTFADDLMKSSIEHLSKFCDNHNINFVGVKTYLDNPPC